MLAFLLLGVPTIPLKEGDGKVSFRAHPKVGRGMVTLLLKVEEPKGDLFCPTVRWEWPDGTSSTEWGECGAEGEGEAPTSWRRSIRLPPGEWDLGVSLLQGKKVIKRLHARVVVVGH